MSHMLPHQQTYKIRSKLLNVYKNKKYKGLFNPKKNLMTTYNKNYLTVLGRFLYLKKKCVEQTCILFKALNNEINYLFLDFIPKTLKKIIFSTYNKLA